MQTHEKMTVPNPPAPTDGEQSFRNDATTSIAQYVEKCNTEFSEEEYDNFLSRIQDPSYLPTMSMQELYSTTFAGRPPIIDGLLHTGAYLLAGAPKVGNPSWLRKSLIMSAPGSHCGVIRCDRAQFCIWRWRMIIRDFNRGCSACLAVILLKSFTLRLHQSNWEKASLSS